MPAVAKLLVGSPLTDRSMVTTQTKRNNPVLRNRELGLRLATAHCEKLYC
jgi:hypothetical protein